MPNVAEQIMVALESKCSDHTFDRVTFAHVTRDEVPDNYDASQGAVLSILQGREDYSRNANGRQEVSMSVFLTFAVPVADGEVLQSVQNDVAAEVIALVSGENLRNGSGQQLTADIAISSVEPEELDEQEPIAAATLVFDVRYRIRSHRPMELAHG